MSLLGLGNDILNIAILVIYGFRINDAQSGMWVFKRELLSRMNLTSDTMAFSEEIKLEAFTLPGVRCRELVIYYKERYGESKLNSGEIFNYLKQLSKMYFGSARPHSASAGAPVRGRE